MSRHQVDAPVKSIRQRKLLSPRRKPYFVALNSIQHAHLGYRKTKQRQQTAGGSWLLRYRIDGKYRETRLANCDDDGLPANGTTILTFADAANLAAKRYSEITAEIAPTTEQDYTICKCVCDYLKFLEAEGKPVEDALWRINTHIEPHLKSVNCKDLTAQLLRDWRDQLAKEPPRVRAPRASGKPAYRDVDMNNPEVLRKRKSTVNRTLTVLRAALNLAFQNDKIESDTAWRKVRGFKGVEARRTRYLTPDEADRLVRACDQEKDFQDLVRGALYTGCRYGELKRAEVRHFDINAGSLSAPIPRSGKARFIVLTEIASRFFEDLTAGRNGESLIFVREDGKKWGAGHQNRRIKESCARAGIQPAINFHQLRHTYASQLVMSGVPLPIVAENLGHRDTRMCEQHYAHLAGSYKRDIIRKLAPNIGGDTFEQKVVAIKR